MGTRADFYVGRDPKTMDWKGSTAWDGYPEGFEDEPWTTAKTEDEFLVGLRAMAEKRDDWTNPDDGWPWPWESSYLTDYVYAFDEGRVWVSNGRYWWPFDEEDPVHEEEGEPFDWEAYRRDYPYMEWPDMSKLKNVTFGKRSGLIVFGG